MTRSQHLAILSSIDHNYRQCWEILCELKTKPTARLQEFQPLLCESMLKLSEEFRRINKSQRGLVTRSAGRNATWIATRLASLDNAKQVLRRAKGIGQCLGNAFAWFFYQHEPSLLELHGKHRLTDSVHADIGGAGEHAVLSATPLYDGAMILHHGITTILRIGDISLFDVDSFRIKGIGEIKTSQVNSNELSVSLTCFADEPFSSSAKSETREQRFVTSASRARKKRLKSQIKKMISTLKLRRDKQPSKRIKVHADTRVTAFATAVESAKVGKLSFSAIADGLVIAVNRHRKCSLTTGLARKPPDDPKKRVHEPPDFAQFGCPGSMNDSLVMDSFAYAEDGSPVHLIGTMPVFWWDLDLELIRQILFHEIEVVALFNPAHLVSKLERKGFDVVMSPEDGKLLVSKRSANCEFRVEGMDYFTRLITQCLYSEETVVEMLEKVATEAAQGATYNKAGRMEIVFNHALFER